jgi:hypothetical protein
VSDLEDHAKSVLFQGNLEEEILVYREVRAGRHANLVFVVFAARIGWL